MEELVKALSNVNINSQSAELIGRYWLYSELVRYASLTIILATILILAFIVIKNFGTGKWK